MSVPSFLFSALDKETLLLSSELDALGGGDAKASSFELHVAIDSKRKKNNDRQVLWNYNSMVGLRDLTVPSDYPVSKSIKYYPVSTVSDINCLERINSLSIDLTNWVYDGFNTCFVSVGMRGIGKTSTLFGESGLKIKPLDHLNTDDSFAHIFLRNIYEKAKSGNDRCFESTIALSAWFVQHHQITDLLLPICEGKDPLKFASVECPTLSTALEVLHSCRSKARGCLAHTEDNETENKTKEVGFEHKHVGHFFMRVLIHKCNIDANQPKRNNFNNSKHDTGNVSCLYLVDLAGIMDTNSQQYKRLNEEDKIAARGNNLQVQSLLKVLGEMRQLSTNAENVISSSSTYSSLSESDRNMIYGYNSSNNNSCNNSNIHQTGRTFQMTSARDAKLTTILAPIIQGNVKTHLMLFLKDGEQRATESHNLLNSLHRVTDIFSACYRVKVKT